MTEKEIHDLKKTLSSAALAAYAEPGLFRTTEGTLRKGNEQTIAFRVGIYLHELLKPTIYSELNLDCEYNKSKNLPKLRPTGNGSTMRPDLIIHNRDNDEQNILAVEFAGWWKPKELIEIDRDKLKEMTDLNFTYKYKLGVLIRFEKDDVCYECFQLGKKTEVGKSRDL